LKKALLTAAVVIALINTIIAAYEYVWPLIDEHGVIEEGDYRGLSIGDSKRDIVRKTTNPVYRTILKIVAYRGSNGHTVLVFDRNQSQRLWDSDNWVLSYPSIHKETVHLSFKDDRLYKIRYVRDMLAP